MRMMILAAALLTLGACATGERMGWLSEGMTPAEVTDVLGSPTGQQRAGNVLVYSYADRIISGWGMNRSDFYTAFEGDKLVAWGQTGEVRQYQSNVRMVMPVPFPGQQQLGTAGNPIVVQTPQQPATLGTYQPSYLP